MNSFSYLRSIKPRYCLITYIILFSFIIVISSFFIFNYYDVYNIKGFVECDDKCWITFSINYLDVGKVSNVDIISVNNEKKYPINTKISELMVDENSKSNYQIVTYEVNQLDNGIVNTFQDIRLYSNKELIINKIIKVLL